MKLINQSFEIINQTDFSLKGIQKFVERCARVSYKSEDRITDDSYEKFVRNLYKLNHSRPFEFGTVHLKFNDLDSFSRFKVAVMLHKQWNDWWIHCNFHKDIVYVSLNYRYYLDIMKNVPNIDSHRVDEDNEYYPKRYTVHFITNRVTMDSFRTHISLSHLAESTRFCNYSKGKFNNELVFVKPEWIKNLPEGDYDCDGNAWYNPETNEIYTNIDSRIDYYLKSLYNAESTYMHLLDAGLKPQEARDILPLSTKSELISCGFKNAWDNFFYRRCANDAHPMARELALSLMKSIYK